MQTVQRISLDSVPSCPVVEVLYMIPLSQLMNKYWHINLRPCFNLILRYFLKEIFPLEIGYYNSAGKYFTLICMDFDLNCSFYLMHFTTNSEYLRDSGPEDRIPIWRNVFTEKCISALTLLCLRKITQTFLSLNSITAWRHWAEWSLKLLLTWNPVILEHETF